MRETRSGRTKTEDGFQGTRIRIVLCFLPLHHSLVDWTIGCLYDMLKQARTNARRLESNWKLRLHVCLMTSLYPKTHQCRNYTDIALPMTGSRLPFRFRFWISLLLHRECTNLCYGFESIFWIPFCRRRLSLRFKLLFRPSHSYPFFLSSIFGFCFRVPLSFVSMCLDI